MAVPSRTFGLWLLRAAAAGSTVTVPYVVTTPSASNTLTIQYVVTAGTMLNEVLIPYVVNDSVRFLRYVGGQVVKPMLFRYRGGEVMRISDE